MSSANLSTGGYTCMNCGLFVGWGTLHTCAMRVQPTPFYTWAVPVWITEERLREIIREELNHDAAP